MTCPYCMYDKTKVVGTSKDLVVKRFRKCLRCGKTFPTTETLDYDEYWKEYKEETICPHSGVEQSQVKPKNKT